MDDDNNTRPKSKRRPRPPTFTPEVEAEIRRIREEFPGMTAHEIGRAIRARRAN